MSLSQTAVQQWTVRSQSGRTYTCYEQANGYLSCDCLGWTRRVASDGSRECKHTRAIEGVKQSSGRADAEAVMRRERVEEVSVTVLRGLPRQVEEADERRRRAEEWLAYNARFRKPSSPKRKPLPKVARVQAKKAAQVIPPAKLPSKLVIETTVTRRFSFEED